MTKLGPYVYLFEDTLQDVRAMPKENIYHYLNTIEIWWATTWSLYGHVECLRAKSSNSRIAIESSSYISLISAKINSGIASPQKRARVIFRN